MVNLTYPSGVGSFAVIVAATNLTNTPTAIGQLEFGTGAIPYGQGHAVNIVLEVTLVANNSDTIVLGFDFSSDAGTTWYTADNLAFGAAIADGVYRFFIQPVLRADNTMRINVSTATPGVTPGTIAIRAQFADVSLPYF